MPRYDVHAPRRGPLLIDVQADWLYDAPNRVVVPLVPHGSISFVAGVTPIVDVNGVSKVMATPFLFSIRRARLRNPIDNLERYRDDIIRAFDFMLVGF